MKKYRIVIADDHDIVLDGIRWQLTQEPDLDVVGEAHDGRSAVDLVITERPDLFIVDKQMPGMDGIHAAKEALATKEKLAEQKFDKWSGEFGVILLTMFADKNYLRRAFQAGVSGYVLKGMAGQELLNAVRAVLAGERYTSPAMAEKADEIFWEIDLDTPPDPYETLAPREREAMDFVLRGLSDGEMAEKMHISRGTAHNYRSSIFQKLGVHTTLQLFRWGVTHKIITVDDEGNILP